MQTSIPPDGGPAFPRTLTINDGIDGYHDRYNEGMSLRDYFAANEHLNDFDDGCNEQTCVALAGPKPAGNWSTNPIEWLKWDATWRSVMKYIRADAMLKAREK